MDFYEEQQKKKQEFAMAFGFIEPQGNVGQGHFGQGGFRPGNFGQRQRSASQDGFGHRNVIQNQCNVIQNQCNVVQGNGQSNFGQGQPSISQQIPGQRRNSFGQETPGQRQNFFGKEASGQRNSFPGPTPPGQHQGRQNFPRHPSTSSQGRSNSQGPPMANQNRQGIQQFPPSQNHSGYSSSGGQGASKPVFKKLLVKSSIFRLSDQKIAKIFAEDDIEGKYPKNTKDFKANGEIYYIRGKDSIFVPNSKEHPFIIGGQTYESVLDYMREIMMLELTSYTYKLRRDIGIGLNGQLEQLGIDVTKREQWIIDRGILHLQMAYLEKCKQNQEFIDQLIGTGTNLLIYLYDNDNFIGVAQSMPEFKFQLQEIAKCNLPLQYSMDYPLTVKSLRVMPKFFKGCNVLGALLMSLRNKIASLPPPRQPVSHWSALHSIHFHITDLSLTEHHQPSATFFSDLKRPAASQSNNEDEPPRRRSNTTFDVVEDQQQIGQISIRNQGNLNRSIQPKIRSGSSQKSLPPARGIYTPLTQSLSKMNFQRVDDYEEGTQYCDMMTPEPTNERAIWEGQNLAASPLKPSSSSAFTPLSQGPRTPQGLSSILNPEEEMVPQSRSVLDTVKSSNEVLFSPASAIRGLSMMSPAMKKKEESAVFKVPHLPSIKTSHQSPFKPTALFSSFNHSYLNGSVTSRASTESPALSVHYNYSIPDDEEFREDEEFAEELLKTPKHRVQISPRRDPEEELARLRNEK